MFPETISREDDDMVALGFHPAAVTGEVGLGPLIGPIVIFTEAT